MKFKILIADDEKEILDICNLFLSKEGYEVVTAENGRQAVERFEQDKIHLAILDIMMPMKNGVEVLEAIREKSRVPVLFLTAKTEDYDKILGLRSGADDYITKPFNPLELVARVEAVLRRTYDMPVMGEKYVVLTNGWLSLDAEEARVTIRSKEIDVTATEYHLLELFLRNLGRILTKKQIFEAIRGEDYLQDDNMIMVHISNLRNKIEDDPKNPTFLKTIRGLGYRMERV